MNKELHDKILSLPCPATQSQFATRHELNCFKDGYQSARQASAALALAAAPQVVADERAAPVDYSAAAKSVKDAVHGIIGTGFYIRLAELDIAKLISDAMSAAPVQAQELVAGNAVEAVLLSDMVEGSHAQYGNGLFATENCVTTLYRAPVQPVAMPDVLAEPTYMTEDQGRDWAWKDVKKDVGTKGWTAGDNGNFFGFFLHGWNYRGQFEKQRAAPAAQGDAKDAERWRWLAENAMNGTIGIRDGWVDFEYIDEATEQVDAAIAAKAAS